MATTPTMGSAAILDALRRSTVRTHTYRALAGHDESGAGLRRFRAELKAPVDIPPEVAARHAWTSQHSYRHVTPDEVESLLSDISPLLAECALGISPGDGHHGVAVTLAFLEGSVLNPFRLEGADLHDVLDSIDEAHGRLFTAFEQRGDLWLPDANLGLDDAVGTAVLLTTVASASSLNQVAPGLETALVSQVLADVSDGAACVLASVGKSGDDSDDDRELDEFWVGLAFRAWDGDIWVADPKGPAFHEPASKLADILAGR